MVKKIGIILFLILAAQCAGRPHRAAPTILVGTAFAQLQENGQPCPPECVTDSMEIVTWYPSPYSEYEELRLYPTQREDNYCDDNKIGLMYYDDGGTSSFADNDKIKICKGTLLGWQDLGGGAYWDKSPNLAHADDIYYTQSGNVGIGTDTPQAKLHIKETDSSEEIITVDYSLNYIGGQQTYTVPVGVTSLTITAYGASGGDDGIGAPAGKGGSARGTINVTPGETLYIYVGGSGNGTSGGYNGGGSGGAGNFPGYGGGGASDVRRGGNTLGHRVIIAGGGGGTGGATNDGNRYDGGGGGSGGGNIGSNGYIGAGAPAAGYGGGGGTQSAVGSGGDGGRSGHKGTSGLGSGGGSGGDGDIGSGGGGGGGGYFGGGGGGGGGYDDVPDAGGGGGGGSGYVSGTNTSIQNDVQTGNGRIVISVIQKITLYVEGTMGVSGSKNFIIPHPTKPGMKLVHSSLEGPEVGVYYRGEAQLDNGQAVISLPDYFEALTSPEGRSVLLTPVYGWAPLYVEDGIKEGRFAVRTADSAKNEQKFYWEVKAVRKDIPPLVVEREDKNGK